MTLFYSDLIPQYRQDIVGQCGIPKPMCQQPTDTEGYIINSEINTIATTLI